MKFLLIILLSFSSIYAQSEKQQKYVFDVVPKKMTIQEKKTRFYALVTPAIDKVYKELAKQYIDIKADLKAKRNHSKIKKLKKIYKVKDDTELLLALKPHPKSIVIAQAAMESAWATSRFFTKAKNIFGIWSFNSKEPRIASEQKRGTKTIWLRKFSSIEESVREYYKLLGRVSVFKKFREVRNKTDNVFKIIKELDKYSEIGDKYAQELGSMIRYNKLTKYDILTKL